MNATLTFNAVGYKAPAYAGLETLARLAIRALPRRVKDVALFLAAPFVGLAYVLAFPAVGAGMLIWAGARAVARK